MTEEILVNVTPRETRVAILEDDQLVESLVDRPEVRRLVGTMPVASEEDSLWALAAWRLSRRIAGCGFVGSFRSYY